MGRANQVLEQVARLRARMATLPRHPRPRRERAPWHVREGAALLDTASYAAMLLYGGHDDVPPPHRRGDQPASATARPPPPSSPAPGTTTTSRCCTSAAPRKHWWYCGTAARSYQDARDTLMLGRTLSALADVEDVRGHGDAALRLERDSLRYKYLAGDVEAIAIGYRDLRQPPRRPRPPARPGLRRPFHLRLRLHPDRRRRRCRMEFKGRSHRPARIQCQRRPAAATWRTCAAKSATSPARTCPASSVRLCPDPETTPSRRSATSSRRLQNLQPSPPADASPGPTP